MSGDALLPGWASLPMITPAPSSPACEPHTPHPAGYLDVDWTADMEAVGYAQRQCSGCGRWLIWEKADSQMRWGAFVRDPRDGGEWFERHRWIDGDLMPLPDRAAAEARCAEIRGRHPEWDVEARQTKDPLPGPWREASAGALEEADDGS